MRAGRGLFPLIWAVIEPLRPACRPATDVARPCRVAVKLPLALVWPVPVYRIATVSVVPVTVAVPLV
jgi:hypothetical protein